MKIRALAAGACVGAACAASVSVALARRMTDLGRNPGNRPLPSTPAASGLDFEEVSFTAARDGLRIRVHP